MAEQFTADELPAFKFYMNIFDANADGKINCSELGEVMKTLHAFQTKKQLKALLKEADADGNGSLDFSEFMKAYGIVLKRRMEDNCDQSAFDDAFFFFDKDGDMSISADELHQLMKVLGEKMTEEELATLIKQADINSDERFTLDEFKKIMTERYRPNEILDGNGGEEA